MKEYKVFHEVGDFDDGSELTPSENRKVNEQMGTLDEDEKHVKRYPYGESRQVLIWVE